jgi:small subunit ribosomal protein S8e
MVRTQRVVKGCVVSVDPTPFKYYWTLHWEDKKINRMPEVDAEKKKHLEEKRNENFQKWRDGKESEGQEAIRKVQEKRTRGVSAGVKRTDNKHPYTDNLDKLHTFFELMNKGRVYARISSRPGQSGRADGYLLEGKELEFYAKKLDKK